eukprot:gene29924-37057_t
MGVFYDDFSREFKLAMDKKICVSFPKMTQEEQNNVSRGVRDIKFPKGMMSKQLNGLITTFNREQLKREGKWKH